MEKLCRIIFKTLNKKEIYIGKNENGIIVDNEYFNWLEEKVCNYFEGMLKEEIDVKC